MASELSRQLTHRFFRYLAITSQSDPKVKTLPSTQGSTTWRVNWQKSWHSWV
jgi:di/tripeptidase